MIKKPSKLIYNFIINNIEAYDIYRYAKKWCESMNVIGGLEDFYKLFGNIGKISNNNVKLRDFQYRLLLGKIYTNTTLYKWKIVDTKKCDYCTYDQNIKHLLYNCKNSRKIWNELERIIADPLLQWDLRNIMDNTVHAKPKSIYNIIVLIVKHHIFQQKCLGNATTYKKVKIAIKDQYNISCYNATNFGDIRIMKEKWSPVQKLFSN